MWISTWVLLNLTPNSAQSPCHFHLSYSYCGHQEKRRELSYLKDWKLTATCSLTIMEHPLAVVTTTIPSGFPNVAIRIEMKVPGHPATGSTWPILWIFNWWGTDGFIFASDIWFYGWGTGHGIIFASYIWFYGWGTGHDFTITLDSQGLISERKEKEVKSGLKSCMLK